MTIPKISLEQWAALVSVVESGSYARAAEDMHKSQSTVTYAIQQIERLCGVKVFEIQGRKSVLTDSGRILYLRGKRLVEDAQSVEQLAGDLSKGWESELRLAVDIIFPTWLLLECFSKFTEERPRVWIQLYESVLSGTTEALLEGRVDLAIGPTIPGGFVGRPLMQIHFVPAAHPEHPLHQMGRPVTDQDLKKHRRLVIRETGVGELQGASIVANERWTVSNKATSIHAACMGLGFAWFPEESIRSELDSGQLKVLPLRDGGDRYAMVYLMFADPESSGPSTLRFAELVQESVKTLCPDDCRPPSS